VNGTQLACLFILHFIADFMCQSDWMALNKSKRLWPLTVHCLVYTIPFTAMGMDFAIKIGLAHFLTDYYTSRATSALWIRGKRHWFFVMIGFDQLIHTLVIMNLAGVI
jgi:hypothetical protein